MPVPHFRRVAVGELNNEVGGGAMNTLFNVGDIDGDGRPDIFTSGRNGRMAWFRNGGDKAWERHIVGEVDNQECGGLAKETEQHVPHPQKTADGGQRRARGGRVRACLVGW